MISTPNHVINVYEIQYLIYGNHRQVEQMGLGTGICKACATRMQAISTGWILIFWKKYGAPLARGPRA